MRSADRADSQGSTTTGCCGTSSVAQPGLVNILCASVKTVRAAVAGFFQGRGTQSTQSSESAHNRWLRITSPCSGSATNWAEQRRRRVPRGSNSHNGFVGADAEPPWDGFCAVCKRPLKIELLGQESAKRCRRADSGRERYAYVITLWGTSPEYVLGAMVLGWSLKRTGTSHDLVVVHTDDVSDSALALLRQAGWQPHLVYHVQEASTLMNSFQKTMRFANVFTKLRVLELVQYSKILMMDIDLLVRDNIDELFDLEAPVAMVRGPKVGYEHGERVIGSYFFSGLRQDGYSWGQSSGINAGVMLLRPDAQVFQQMLLEIGDERHPEHIQGNGPEQDYLSRYYAAEWRHLSVAYNFQLHHMYFAISPVLNDSGADRLEYLFHPERIKIIHYSSEPKPWARKLEDCYAGWTDDEWATELLMSFTGYRAWVLKEEDPMRREGDRHGFVLGPDGNLHTIDWARCKSKWHGDRGYPPAPSATAGDDTCSTVYCDENSSPESASLGNTEEKATVALLNGDCNVSADFDPNSVLQDDPGLFSEDGWPLGEAIGVSQAAIDAAEKVLRLSQELWFAAYEELANDLGESDLAGVVRAATVGPIIRQDPSVYDWKPSAYDWKPPVRPPVDNNGWTRDGTGGWWMEAPIEERFVATCSIIPKIQASLSVGGTVLLAASCEGVHVAAASASDITCPSPVTFLGGDDANAAATWAEAVPTGAMVMVAAIDTRGDQVGAVLEALAQGGLGCPNGMPPAGCAVAATVGQKGKESWYVTHAAAHIAIASHPAVKDTAS